MATFHEAKSPLTADNVAAWARAAFPAPYKKLCDAARKPKWIAFDEKKFSINRAVWRSLGRSHHKRLLVIGEYAPGPENDDEEPTDRVVAHVHANEAEASFYRIAEVDDGAPSLQSVKSTSEVSFHAPFCDVGDKQGGSEAIRRVSALIMWYFLYDGHTRELARPKGDPTMFTRNFRDACMWVGNEGTRPSEPPTRRSSVANIKLEEVDDSIPVRPKRPSTMPTIFRPADPPRPSPVKRSATDGTTIKRQREEDAPSRPTKRRTRSEHISLSQIRRLIVPVSTPSSPLSPAPRPYNYNERVHAVFEARIDSLKDQNATLETNNHRLQLENEGLREEVGSVQVRLHNAEADMVSLKARVAEAEKMSAEAQAELLAVKNGLRKEGA